MSLLLKFCISYTAFLLHQRSRYDGLTSGDILRALLVHNELIQNNLSASYQFVASLKEGRKGKQILVLWCWTATQEIHVETTDISKVFVISGKPGNSAVP